MTKDEFRKFAMALKTYYPRENLLPNKEAVELWFMQLQDIPYNVATASLNKWVAQNKWSPSIAEVRETATALCKNDSPEWGEAWEKVCHTIEHYGYVRPKEALESIEAFSTLARKTTEQLGYEKLCQCDVDNMPTMMANFRKIYESLAERERKEAQIPAITKQFITQIQEEGNQWLLQDTKAEE